MPNLFNNLRECFGFSQIMKSTCFNIFTDLKLMSSRLPIGVDIIYKPLFKLSILFTLTFIISCAPQNFIFKEESIKKIEEKEPTIIQPIEKKEEKTNEEILFSEQKILNEINLLLPKTKNQKITTDLINAFEYSLYKKEIKNFKINVNLYSDNNDLNEIILKNAQPGKIFIGPLTSKDASKINQHCSEGVLFFSFASDRNLAGNCVYLINFFPEDDLITLFNSFEADSKIALLFPDNNYGHYINSIIDSIATRSNSIIVNRAFYKEDLTDARQAIKELGKYEIRKYELERQKNILSKKNDEISKKALKKIQRFETAGALDFTHIILPDYGIRLLQIAPLLPFYDIDPNRVQFVGTGVWDNEAFFDEPSLQGAIFPGIDKNKRVDYINEYIKNYGQKPERAITIPYDLIGIVAYVLNNELDLKSFYKLLNEDQITFDGIDGQFTFKNNIISRELSLLKISKGKTELAEWI